MQFHEGVPDVESLSDWFPRGGVLVLDDLMAEGSNDNNVLDLFAPSKHHRPLPVPRQVRRRLCLPPWQRASGAPCTSRWGTKNPDEGEVGRFATVAAAAAAAVAVGLPGVVLTSPFAVEEEAAVEAAAVVVAVVAVVAVAGAVVGVVGTTTTTSTMRGEGDDASTKTSCTVNCSCG